MGMRVMNSVSNAAATRQIRRIVLHSQYDQFTSDYDIALLELSAPVFFNELVQPVCVPASSHAFTSGTSCFVTGWGVLSEEGMAHCRNSFRTNNYFLLSWGKITLATLSWSIWFIRWLKVRKMHSKEIIFDHTHWKIPRIPIETAKSYIKYASHFHGSQKRKSSLLGKLLKWLIETTRNIFIYIFCSHLPK